MPSVANQDFVLMRQGRHRWWPGRVCSSGMASRQVAPPCRRADLAGSSAPPLPLLLFPEWCTHRLCNLQVEAVAHGCHHLCDAPCQQTRQSASIHLTIPHRLCNLNGLPVAAGILMLSESLSECNMYCPAQADRLCFHFRF